MLSHGKAFLPANANATATATAIFFPVCSRAAAILRLNALTASQAFTVAEVIRPGDTLEFRFTALADLMIDAFSVSGTGNNTEADVRDIGFGLTLPPTGFFNPVSSDGTAAAGNGVLTGAVFSIYFQDGISNDVGITLSFRTDPAAAAPPQGPCGIAKALDRAVRTVRRLAQPVDPKPAAQEGDAMQTADLSDLVLRLTTSAMDKAAADHQAQMADALRDITPFDAAWWGWSNFSGGQINLVRSVTQGLPGHFEEAVRPVLAVDPFIRHGRNLPVFSMAISSHQALIRPEWRDFAAEFGLKSTMNAHCRLSEGSSYNFFMSLYRFAGPDFSAEEIADFRIIIRHLEQSLSLALRGEMRRLTPLGGEAAVVDGAAQIVRATRGFRAALASEPLSPRRLKSVLTALAMGQARWSGAAISLTSAPYGSDLVLIRQSRPGLWDRLAPQETRVAELYLTGLTMADIALRLNVSPHTVRNQISSIYRKTGVRGKMELTQRLSAPS